MPSFNRIHFPFFLILLGVAFLINSCAPFQPLPPSNQIPPGVRQDIQHTIAPGETLWRLSQIYNVPVTDILNANHLPGDTKLQLGQSLIIPRAKNAEALISLFPSKKWRYIIVHHSGTEEGNSLAFHKSHLAKGWDRGVGYHFVIDNGSAGKPDGFIEVTPRWLKQEDGAHCKASDMNTKAIGICLVGNFDEEELSPAQLSSLIDLVNKLRKYYHLPKKNILGHRHVRGSQTDCPGYNFPWGELITSLN